MCSAVAAALAGITFIVVMTLVLDSALDFYVYYLAADLIAGDRSPYTVAQETWDRLAAAHDIGFYAWPYRYSPHTAILVMPLTVLPPYWAMVVWTAMNCAAVLAGAILVGRAVGGRWGVPVSLVTLAWFGPFYNSIGNGQVEGLAFLGLALGFWGLARGRDGVAGLGVAVAAALKLTPLALVVYFGWRRRSDSISDPPIRP